MSFVKSEAFLIYSIDPYSFWFYDGAFGWVSESDPDEFIKYVDNITPIQDAEYFIRNHKNEIKVNPLL